MKLTLLLTSALLFCGCSRSPTTSWQPIFDGGHHIGVDGAKILAFEQEDDSTKSVVFFFPFDINSSTQHTSNAKSRTFDYRGTISTSPENHVVLRYHLSSTETQKLTCNGADYRLRDGSVFHVSRKGDIVQLPIPSQKPTKQYVSSLVSYFAENATATTNKAKPMTSQ